MDFPILYKTDRTGKIRKWSIWVKKNVVYRQDGIDSKDAKIKDVTEKKIESNTRNTAEEQALKEAKKMWLKKLDDNFKPKESDTSGYKMYLSAISQKNKEGGGNRDIDLNKKILTKEISYRYPVMLAKSFFDENEEPNSFVKKMFSVSSIEIAFQPKLDGQRCIAFYDKKTNEVKLNTRNHKEFMFMNHIRNALKNTFKKYPDMIFDGEIYYHNPKVPSVERYQFVSSVAKVFRNEPHKEENKVSYWIFDIIPNEGEISESYVNRYKILKKIFKSNNDEIVLTETSFKTFEKFSIKSVTKFFCNIYDHYVNDLSFEGLMLRDIDSLYKEGRQSTLIKFKLFLDEDWTIIDAKQSVGGNQNGAVIWVLENGEGLTVEAKQIGNVEESKKMYTNRKKYFGKKMNIRFNEKTSNGIPRFPRAIAIVEDK